MKSKILSNIFCKNSESATLKKIQSHAPVVDCPHQNYPKTGSRGAWIPSNIDPRYQSPSVRKYFPVSKR